MLTKYKLNHVAGGLMGTFISRYNDYQGYWAFGVMVRELRDGGNRVHLDLLAGSAEPAAPAAASAARAYADYLGRALGKLGASPSDLAEAGMLVEFGLPAAAPAQPWRVMAGDPFRCTLRLVGRDGRVASRQASEHCMPVDLFEGRRSAGWHG
ncbi:hypothetical protein LQ564_20690 [Massilia sp. G4R7]|uniref:Uncharacterized protein n=1 Tax=Massilia phyllostachyos TaxID=2898585 RepID=A0ABS8QAE3_9BURK|nr:hypothetical protein [Massilia phyllostachyos]MCD2518719.1 hypothetical protein [Massilia phyllostachyos]